MQDIKEKDLEVKSKYQLRDVLIEGVKYGSLSPYDVPNKVKASYNETKKLLSIKFAYLTPDEPTHVQESDGGEVRFHVGEISGKLYEVEIYCPSKEFLPNSIRVKITSALDRLIADSEKRTPRSLVQHENLRVTKEFLSEEPELETFIRELAAK
jgi:hypothetical protein